VKGKSSDINKAINELYYTQDKLFNAYKALLKDETIQYTPTDLETSELLTSRKVNRLIVFIHWLLENTKNAVNSQSE